jgi:hypothetical protein
MYGQIYTFGLIILPYHMKGLSLLGKEICDEEIISMDYVKEAGFVPTDYRKEVAYLLAVCRKAPPRREEDVKNYIYELPLPDGLLHQQRERFEREMKRLLIEHEARINREWNKRLRDAVAEKEERIRELEERFNGQNGR